MILSPDQQQAFDHILDWRKTCTGNSLLRMGGFAGCGKTTVLAEVAKKLNGPIAFGAYTGRASGVMKNKLHEADFDTNVGTNYCGTLHGLLYQPAQKINPKTNLPTGEIDWIPRPIPLPFELIVIDEASMVPEEMFKHIKAHDIPILAVGDHGQLPPIKSKFNLMENPDIKLEKIHRQAEGNPIIRLSRDVRETGKIPRDAHDDRHVRLLDQKLYLESELRARFERLATSQLLDVAVLVRSNEDRVKINFAVRYLRFATKDITPLHEDILICLKNYRHLDGNLKIFNGYRAIVEKLSEQTDFHYFAELHIPDMDDLFTRAKMFKPQFHRQFTIKALEECHKAGFQTTDLRNIGHLYDYGYAMTVHKAQGSQFKDVILALDGRKFWSEEDRRWLYTAVTRAVDILTILKPGGF